LKIFAARSAKALTHTSLASESPLKPRASQKLTQSASSILCSGSIKSCRGWRSISRLASSTAWRCATIRRIRHFPSPTPSGPPGQMGARSPSRSACSHRAVRLFHPFRCFLSTAKLMTTSLNAGRAWPTRSQFHRPRPCGPLLSRIALYTNLWNGSNISCQGSVIERSNLTRSRMRRGRTNASKPISGNSSIRRSANTGAGS